MKNYITSTIAIIATMVFIFGVDSAAQSATRITVEVPFDFYVRNELLPAGKYELETTNRQAIPSGLIVRSVGRPDRRAIIVPALAGNPYASGDGLAVTFNQYGPVHYLSSIQSDANGPSIRLLMTSAEKQFAKSYEKTQAIAIRPKGIAAR